MRHHLLAGLGMHMTPNFSALPGAGPIQQIIDGVGAFALFLSLTGVIIGGAMWGVGSLSANYHQAAVGKRATLYSVAGAIVIGSASALINWAFQLGTTTG